MDERSISIPQLRRKLDDNSNPVCDGLFPMKISDRDWGIKV